MAFRSLGRILSACPGIRARCSDFAVVSVRGMTGIYQGTDHSGERHFASFSYQAQSWNKPRRVLAKVEWHPVELYPRVGFIVTNLVRSSGRVQAICRCPSWSKGRS
jgi:Transposase DDE domain group 1